jgi:hypothetical protein
MFTGDEIIREISRGGNLLEILELAAHHQSGYACPRTNHILGVP